jgi:hypothetical protein
MIQTAEPSRVVRIRYAERRIRSMTAPDMIEPVVQEKSKKARKKTRLRWPVRSDARFGPMPSLHGAVRPQKPGNSEGPACPSAGPPCWKQP